MPSTSDRVRDLIRESGLTQHDFAVRIGLDDSKLSKALSGSRRFSSLDLARIADLSSVTVDWLITGDQPPLAVAARTTGGSARRAVNEARRLATMRSDLSDLGFAQPWRPLEISAGTSGWTEQGTQLAMAARARIEGADQTDLVGLVEAVFGADVAVLDLGSGFDGLATSSDEVKLIVLATSAVPTRQRFTLAHELGHLLAGDDQGVHLDEDVFDRAQGKTPSELRANAFAAAFLMPEPTLRAAVGGTGLTEQTFAALACDLVVTPSALAYRLKSLRLIDAGTCDRFRSLTARRAASLAERGPDFARQVSEANRQRPPGLLTRDAYAAYDAGATTLRPYANLLGVDVDEIRRALDVENGTMDVS
ncbi:helix-turn-helix domain-containing protein [Pseudonocardia sp. DLS-67]